MNNSWHTTSGTLYPFLNKYHNFHLSPPPPPPPPILFNVAYTRSSRRGLSCESKIKKSEKRLIFSRHGELSEGN